MKRIISVVTPVWEPSSAYLLDVYQSLATQQMPSEWDWQWVVQEDGQSGKIAPLLPKDDRISVGMGRHGGPGVARTMALSRVRGELVKALDADDLLTSGSLARDIDVLTRYPNVGWTTCRVLDLMPDGTTMGFDHDPPEGPIGRDAVLRHWVEHNYRAQVLPGTLCIRRDLLLALGGWMALPASEDTGLLLAANALSDGYFIAEVGLLYRKWPSQSTAQDAHTAQDEWYARMRLIEARTHVLRRSRVLMRLNFDWRTGDGHETRLSERPA